MHLASTDGKPMPERDQVKCRCWIAVHTCGPMTQRGIDEIVWDADSVQVSGSSGAVGNLSGKGLS